MNINIFIRFVNDTVKSGHDYVCCIFIDESSESKFLNINYVSNRSYFPVAGNIMSIESSKKYMIGRNTVGTYGEKFAKANLMLYDYIDDEFIKECLANES